MKKNDVKKPQSFLEQYRNIIKGVQDFTIETVKTGIQSMIDEATALREACKESLYNMPDSLQDSSSSGELLQQRIDTLDGWISDLDNICLHDLENKDGGGLTKSEEEQESLFLEIMDDIGNCQPDF